MVDVGSWYDRNRREAARCSMRVGGVGRGRREAARRSMRVAGVVGVGRSISRFLTVRWINQWVSIWCWQLGHVESSERSDYDLTVSK